MGLCHTCNGARAWAIGGWPLLCGSGPGSPEATVAQDLYPHLDLTSHAARHELASPGHLCGFGEAGEEHLCAWCPATADTWERLHCPSGRALVKAIREYAEDAPILCALIHKTAFLH